MSCNKNCIRIVKSTAILDLGAFLVIVIPPTNFKVRENIKLILCQTIPTIDPLLDPQVVIFDGTNVYLAFNKLSEFVRRSNIKCRTCYPAIVSNDPLHFQIYCVTDNCKCPNEALLPAVIGGGALTEISEDIITAHLNNLISPKISTVGGTDNA